MVLIETRYLISTRKKGDEVDKKDQPHLITTKFIDHYKPDAPVNVISYIITLDDGPVPSKMKPKTPDIEHYVESQISRGKSIRL